jgi:hypothetical protein
VRNPSGFEGVGFALVLGIPTLLSIFVAFFFLLPAPVRNFLNPVEGHSRKSLFVLSGAVSFGPIYYVVLDLLSGSDQIGNSSFMQGLRVLVFIPIPVVCLLLTIFGTVLAFRSEDWFARIGSCLLLAIYSLEFMFAVLMVV